MVVVQETEAAAVMGKESLVLVSSQDTEVAAVKEPEQESLTLLKKLLFNAKNFSDKSVSETVLSSCNKTSTDGKVKIRMGLTSNALKLPSGHTRALDFHAMEKVLEDCDPPCFKLCADSKNPLMIEVGNVYNKHNVIALEVHSVLDPGDHVNANGEDHDSCEYDEFSCTEEMVQNAEKAFTLQETKSQAYYALSMNCATITNFQGKLTDKILKERDMSSTQKVKHQVVHLLCYSLEKHIVIKVTVNPGFHAAKAIGYILCTNPTGKKYWSIDSGATNHINGRSKWIKKVRPIPKEKKMCLLNAAGKVVRLSGIGDIVGPEVRLYNVYLSDDLEDDELYVSIGQLTGEGYTVLIDKGEVTIRLAENFNHIVGTGSLDKNAKAYRLEFFNGSVLEKGKGNLDEKQGPEYKLAEGIWVLDSGCHNHITCKKSFLNKKWKMKKGKRFGVAGSEQLLACKLKGNITEGEVRLNDVYFCKGSNSNIISVCQLDVLGYNFFFSRNHCEIKYKEEENLVGLAHADEGNLNYYVEFLHSKE